MSEQAADEPRPAKPVGPMPSDEELLDQPAPDDEDVPEDAFMSPEEAAADDTIDHEENDEGEV
jgi:hypothetical protein